jgi:hypothetical protein
MFMANVKEILKHTAEEHRKMVKLYPFLKFTSSARMKQLARRP